MDAESSAVSDFQPRQPKPTVSNKVMDKSTTIPKESNMEHQVDEGGGDQHEDSDKSRSEMDKETMRIVAEAEEAAAEEELADEALFMSTLTNPVARQRVAAQAAARKTRHEMSRRRAKDLQRRVKEAGCGSQLS